MGAGGRLWRSKPARPGIAPFALGDMKAWREGSRELRAAARRLLGEAEAGAAEARAASRLEDMPRLRGRVREVLAGLEAVKLRDTGDAFMSLTDRVERLAVRDDTLALHAEGYGRATMYAKELDKREALPEAARRRVGEWLARDRRWNEELASVAGLAGGSGQSADPAAQREAAGRPAVAEAIRRERERLLRVPEPAHWLRWTGEEPLVPGDRLRVGDGIMEIIVVSAGAAGGMHENDRLQVRILDTAGPDETPGLGAVIPQMAESLVSIGCARAAWSDERLRELELARHRSVPSWLCRLACDEPVPGDRIAWTEDAGEGRVRTVEAKVTARRRRHTLRQPRAPARSHRRLRARRSGSGNRHREDCRRRRRARLFPGRMERRGPPRAHPRPSRASPGAPAGAGEDTGAACRSIRRPWTADVKACIVIGVEVRD